MLPNLDPANVYAAAGPGMLADAVKGDLARVYVPNLKSNDVYVIDPATFQVVDRFPGGNEPQHVIPSYDLRTLYVAADKPGHSSLTPIDPRTGEPGDKIPVEDPYNLYFTPDGRFAIVVAEAFKRLDFYNPHTWKLVKSLPIPTCAGIDHMDFSADGTLGLFSCEYAGRMVVVDIAKRQYVRTIMLGKVMHGAPQDTRLSPDGTTFYVADMHANGVYLIDGAATRVEDFIPTGKETHGLYFDRESKRLFITNRGEGSISVLDLATKKVTAKWRLPGKATPDMGGLTADGKQFWVSGRRDNVVYAISTDDGHVLARIPVGTEPHGLCVWPQPGRYSLGHTGTLR
jgi:YVTN family beta-propeller protein